MEDDYLCGVRFRQPPYPSEHGQNGQKGVQMSIVKPVVHPAARPVKLLRSVVRTVTQPLRSNRERRSGRRR
jgi:hypothetical protein